MQDAADRHDASRHVSVIRRPVLVRREIDPSPQRRVLMEEEEERHLALNAAVRSHFSVQGSHIPHERSGLGSSVG